MRLREAVGEDLDAVLALAIAFYAEDGFSTAPGDLRRNLSQLIGSPTARVVVCDGDGDGDRVVAFAITTTVIGLEGGLVAELEDLYVVPRLRRRGLAGRLIEDAARWASARGCGFMQLVVAPNGRDASHLFDYYGKRGFLDEGRRVLTRPFPDAGTHPR